ncbi:MAG: hypothetical protein LJE94_07815 [Deltaproteobacteria bacterium]|nr:hypothetical protein [Deltaproteobacteria bacterium]
MPELTIEKIHHADPYIVCHRNKGRSKKHIAVCQRCRWRKKCRAFRLYWQPELPFTFVKPH